MKVAELKKILDDNSVDESFLEADIDISFISASKNNKLSIKTGYVTGWETYKVGYNDFIHIGLICREQADEY